MEHKSQDANKMPAKVTYYHKPEHRYHYGKEQPDMKPMPKMPMNKNEKSDCK